jgi:hypothetical protein
MSREAAQKVEKFLEDEHQTIIGKIGKQPDQTGKPTAGARNKESGSIGSALRASVNRNDAPAMAKTPKPATTSGCVQPSSPLSTNPKVSHPSAELTQGSIASGRYS